MDLRNKRCECGKTQPSFGLPGDAAKDARWCAECQNPMQRLVDSINEQRSNAQA